jgi:carbonic anhydrase
MRCNKRSFAVAVIFLFLATLSPLLADDPCPAEWGYGPDNGPDKWGSMKEEWALCGVGSFQSPIDIANAQVDGSLQTIQTDYPLMDVRVENKEHEIKVVPGSTATLKRGSEVSKLLYFHFHVPSENKIAGEAADGEIHFVHQLPSGRLLVVGVLLREGDENAMLQQILALKPDVCKDKTSFGRTIDLTELLPSLNRYFFFEGSLTTPPCSEGVTWIVLEEKLEVSEGQIAALKLLPTGNARPVQPLRRLRLRQ